MNCNLDKPEGMGDGYKPIYRMSGAGECLRALAAERLGYEPLPRTRSDEDRLLYYSRCEALAAAQITDLGYRLEPSSLCQLCKDRYGDERYGIHVEIDTTLFTLVGHLDRRLVLDDNKLPVEIKSLGRFAWQRFAKERFDGFTGYAGQEACYLEAEGMPGIYWVLNRDTGQHLSYIVNDHSNQIKLDGFEKISLPITFNQIMDKLNEVEVCASEGTLPDSIIIDDCRWCRYKYLCIQEDKNIKEETSSDLVAASKQYEEARELERTANELKQEATQTLLNHSKATKIDKFRVGNISLTYRGQKVRESIDVKTLKLEVPDLYEKYKKESKPFDDFSIRILGEKLDK